MRIADPKLRDALCLAGWAEEREVDISTWVQEMEKTGYSMNSCSRLVLSSLGGLTIAPIESPEQVYQPTLTFFNPMLLKWGLRPTPVEERLGTVLSPLGECLGDASMFIAEDSSMYAEWSGIWKRLGQDFEDSLATLIFARKRGEQIAFYK